MKQLMILALLTFLLVITFTAKSANIVYPEIGAWIGTSDETITIKWDRVEVAHHYEFVLFSIDRERATISASVPQTALNEKPSVLIQPPRTGMYKALVRSCTLEECSEDWSESTDPTKSVIIDPNTSEFISRGWIIYGYPAPPSNPSVE